MTDLLAQAGETVHVIAHRWDHAPAVREESNGGRLIVHRVALDEPIADRWTLSDISSREQVPRGLLASYFPAQAFSWQASLLAEQLIDREGIDVIEAQEWEAPLYYLQLRRALNLGPAARPPCVVHIHSPSERIFA
ncbi:MAG: glycosyltransferase, partial [Vicinamibacterales bacterium]